MVTSVLILGTMLGYYLLDGMREDSYNNQLNDKLDKILENQEKIMTEFGIDSTNSLDVIIKWEGTDSVDSSVVWED